MDRQRKNSRTTGIVTAERKKIRIDYTTLKCRLQAIFLAAVTVLLIIVVTYKATAPSPTYNSVEYRVKSGDTLWTLADEYCPDSMDKREWIHKVMRDNDIVGYIYPGDTVVMAEVSE